VADACACKALPGLDRLSFDTPPFRVRVRRYHAGSPREGSRMTKFELNGRRVEVDAPGETPLLWVLRDQLGLTGTKYGCGRSLCGACTVYVDGEPARSCQMPIAGLAGRRVTTIEGLEGRVAEAVQAAWDRNQVPQCGYCQSGQVMAATALLVADPTPDAAAVERAMSGHLCRCGTYGRVRRAIADAARALEDRS